MECEREKDIHAEKLGGRGTEVGINVEMGLWGNQKTALDSGEDGKSFQLTQFRPTSLNPATFLFPCLNSL